MHGLRVHYFVLYATAGRLAVEDLELTNSGVVLVVGLSTGVGVLLTEGELLQVCASITGMRRMVEAWGFDVWIFVCGIG